MLPSQQISPSKSSNPTFLNTFWKNWPQAMGWSLSVSFDRASQSITFFSRVWRIATGSINTNPSDSKWHFLKQPCWAPPTQPTGGLSFPLHFSGSYPVAHFMKEDLELFSGLSCPNSVTQWQCEMKCPVPLSLSGKKLPEAVFKSPSLCLLVPML